jgi:hypothetical protein
MSEASNDIDLLKSNQKRLDELISLFKNNSLSLDNWNYFKASQLEEIEHKLEIMSLHMQASYKPYLLDDKLVSLASQTILDFQSEIQILRMSNKMRRSLEDAAHPIKVELVSVGSSEIEGIRKTNPCGDYIIQFLPTGPYPAEESVVDEIIQMAIKSTKKATNSHKVELALQSQCKSDAGVLTYRITSPRSQSIALNLIFPPISSLKAGSPPSRAMVCVEFKQRFPYKKYFNKNNQVLWTANILLRIWR